MRIRSAVVHRPVRNRGSGGPSGLARTSRRRASAPGRGVFIRRCRPGSGPRDGANANPRSSRAPPATPPRTAPRIGSKRHESRLSAFQADLGRGALARVVCGRGRDPTLSPPGGFRSPEPALLSQLALRADVAAQLGHRRVAVRHRRLGQPHLGFRQRELPAVLPAPRRCRTRGGRPRSWCRPARPGRRARAKPTPRAARSCTVLTRRARFRPSRSRASRCSCARSTTPVASGLPDCRSSVDRIARVLEATHQAPDAPDRGVVPLADTDRPRGGRPDCARCRRTGSGGPAPGCHRKPRTGSPGARHHPAARSVASTTAARPMPDGHLAPHAEPACTNSPCRWSIRAVRNGRSLGLLDHRSCGCPARDLRVPPVFGPAGSSRGG